MALQWKREPWRKLYVREEGSFAGLPLYARALAGLLIKLVDDHGRIALGGRSPWDAIAFRAGATRGDRRLLRGHVEQLLEDGYLVVDGDAVRIRNFVPAQLRYDRVRGEHELADERHVRNDGAPNRPRPSTEPSAIEPRPSTEPSAIEPRPSTEPSAKSEPSAGIYSIHAVASRSETKRYEPKRNERESCAREGDLIRGLVDLVWTEQEDLRQRLQAEGIGAGSRGLGLVHPSKSDLLARLAEQHDAARGRNEKGPDEAVAACRHVLAVLAAEARESRSLRWLNGGHWKADRFAAALAQSPEEAAARARVARGGAAAAERFHAVRDRSDYPDPETEMREF